MAKTKVSIGEDEIERSSTGKIKVSDDYFAIILAIDRLTRIIDARRI